MSNFSESKARFHGGNTGSADAFLTAKYGKKPLFPKAFLKHIIADVYFVSNRNGGITAHAFAVIIADVYFVSNRNCVLILMTAVPIIADVYFVSNRNQRILLLLKVIIIADVYFVSNRNHRN